MTKEALLKLQLQAIRRGLRATIIETLKGIKHSWCSDCKICEVLDAKPKGHLNFCWNYDCELCPLSVLGSKEGACVKFARKYTVTKENTTREENALNSGLIASFLYSMEQYLLETKEPLHRKKHERSIEEL